MEGPVKKRGGFFKKRVVEPEPETEEAREAREALEAAARQAEEAEAARIAAIGAAWAQTGERVRARLPSSLDYRQAYFLSLLRQGREAEEQGRFALATHCRTCIENGLAALSPHSPAASKAAAPSTDSSLSLLKSRWDDAARQRAATLLERHGARLAPAEREAYGAHNGDAQSLRRKLIDRLLRAAAYRRRGARLSGWKATVISGTNPAGPYNDFVALEQTVQRIASLHPEWAAEFLDLYSGLNKVRAAYQTLLPTAKR